jgi:enamine deaminase RidA (YjgF/YER057c/UK114 family)
VDRALALLALRPLTVHLSDANLFARYNEVYRRRFRVPYPARVTVGSDLHVVPGIMILIDVIAYVGR